MTNQGIQTRQLQDCLDRLQAGDEAARDALIEHSMERLRNLTSRLKQDFPTLGRYHETDDIFQQAVMRLYRSLRSIQPENIRAYLGLAAKQIRRELIDVTRSLKGSHGLAANLVTNKNLNGQNSSNMPPSDPPQETAGPVTLQYWTEFHQQVEQLSDDERQIFDLMFYNEMTQEEVADLLEISTRTVKRRWRSAKLHLSEALGGNIEMS